MEKDGINIIFSKYRREDKKEFFEWLVNLRNFSIKASEKYIVDLKKIERYSKEKKYISTSIYELETKEISKLREELSSDFEFLELIKYKINSMLEPLKLLSDYQAYQAKKNQVIDNKETLETKRLNQLDRKEKAVHDDLFGVNVKLSDLNTPFYKKYDLKPEDYKDIDIISLGFLYRLEERLRNEGIRTLEDLLKLSDRELGTIKYISQGNINEISAFFNNFSRRVDKARRIQSEKHVEENTKESLSATKKQLEPVGLNTATNDYPIDKKEFDFFAVEGVPSEVEKTKLSSLESVIEYRGDAFQPCGEHNSIDRDVPIQESIDDEENKNTSSISDSESFGAYSNGIHESRKNEEDRERHSWHRLQTDQNKLLDNHNPSGEKENLSIGEVFCVDPKDYAAVILDENDFSTRTYSRLNSVGIRTLDALLSTSFETLQSIRGFGATCRKEIERYVQQLPESIENMGTRVDSECLIDEIMPFVDYIKKGDFEYIEQCDHSASANKVINRFKSAYYDLGEELVSEALNNSESIVAIRDAFDDYYAEYSSIAWCKKTIASIPNRILNKKAETIISQYSNDYSTKEYLLEMNSNVGCSLQEFFIENAFRIKENDRELIKLIRWCGIDIKTETNSFLNALKNDERTYKVIEMRAAGNTLEQIGEVFGITRERVRQIENKSLNRFKSWVRKIGFPQHILLWIGREDSFSEKDLESFFNEESKIVSFMLRSIELENLRYNKELELFVTQDRNIEAKVKRYINELPEIVDENDVANYISVATEEYALPQNLLEASFKKTYKKTGKIYYRGRLSLEKIYSDILKRFYPNGIHVYTEQQDFREKVFNEYEIDLSEKSDHAIESLLGRIGFLVGRGVYKLRDSSMIISDELATEIKDFINNSQSPVFMTNTLFAVFEKELREEGIDNKYYLQALLRDRFNDEWIFRRDYISKDKRYTSIGSSIIELVKKSETPISKEEIKSHFPGVTDIVINFALNDPEVINLFGKYIHGTKLTLSASDISYIKRVVMIMTDEKGYCHDGDIFSYINSDYPELLSNNFIHYPYSAFSLLEYLFSDEFVFKRPFVSRDNVEFENPLEALKEIVEDTEVITTQEIISFTKENKLYIYSQLELFDSFNDSHLLMDGYNLASISYIGVDEEKARIIENIVAEEITEATPIANLECISFLPSLNVPWNAWLIYSILKKWSSNLTVYTSDSQFKHSFPIVSQANSSKETSFDLELDHAGKIHTSDDINNIDSIIEDYIDEELGDF